MGLDMYLSARRRFKVDGDDGVAILTALGEGAVGRITAEMAEDSDGLYVAGWEFHPEERRAVYTAMVAAADMTALHTEESPSAYVRIEEDEVVVQLHCAYWRKANAVHGWFVRECQDGVDECQDTEVDWEKLAELAKVAGRALAAYEAGDPTTAGRIMAPTSGFFFGGTDVDESFAVDMRDTIRQVDRSLRAARPGDVFVYHSSW